MLKGIGKSLAEKIYAAFGDDTLNILENDPRRLLEVKGIREKKLEGIIQSYIKNQDIHLLTRLLSPHGISYRTIVRIRKTLGDGAASIVKENPYMLCRVQGIGFKTADDVALKMGIPADSLYRVKGAIIYAMGEAMNNGGHVYVRRDDLMDACIGYKGILAGRNANVEKSIVESCIDSMLADGDLAQPKLSIDGIEPDIIFLPRFLTYETISAYTVASLVESPAPSGYPDDWSSVILEAESEAGIELADLQREAVKMALSSQFSIITGGPGSGKTTSLKIVTSAFLKALPGASIVLAAPTGRAARRMYEQTGMEASTIHRLLCLKPDEHTDFSVPCEEYLEADFLIVDESSMIDASLFTELMYRIMPGTKVLLLGDTDQLPSVGPGNVLRELLSIPTIVPSIKLDKVFRQGEDSIIPLNASHIRKGETDLVFKREQFFHMRCPNEDAGADAIERLIKRLIELEMLESSQILCPMRRRGACCTTKLNVQLHDIVNPPSTTKPEVDVAGTIFRLGDKVMQTKNTENTSNGDIGYISWCTSSDAIAKRDDSDESVILFVKYDAYPNPVPYTYEEALELIHAIAITIHKSQGGEFPIVIIPMFSSMSFFIRRNLIYTAITRAQKQVVIVADDGAIPFAITHEDTSKRNTTLARLTRYCAENPRGRAELMQQ